MDRGGIDASSEGVIEVLLATPGREPAILFDGGRDVASQAETHASASNWAIGVDLENSHSASFISGLMLSNSGVLR